MPKKEQQAELVVGAVVPASPQPDGTVAIHAAAGGTMVERLARDPTFDADKLDRLLQMQERDRRANAEALYNAAAVRFQQRCPIIARGDTANGRPYARMDRIWREIRPLLTECGLAVTWESCAVQGESVTIKGHLRHSGGHTVAIDHTIPMPEANRGQNAAQRAASAETYAKRYAICSALGIQTGDDDDGNAGAQSAPLDDGARAELADLLRAAAFTPDRTARFFEWAGCARLDDFPADKFAEAAAILRKAAGR